MFFKELIAKFNQISDNRIGIIVFSLCTILGFLSGLFYFNVLTYGDEFYYYETAKLLKSDFGLLLSTPRIGVTESLNAIIQGAIMLIPGNDFWNVYFIQIIVFSLTGFFIYKLGALFIGKYGALATIFFYMINNYHWAHIYNFKPGVWVNFFLILTLYFAFKEIKEPNRLKFSILIGIFSSLLLLTDLRYLPHLLLIYVFLLLGYTPFKIRVRNFLLSILVLILTLAPWIIRQSIVFDKFIFVSDINTITIKKVLNTKSYQRLEEYASLLEPLSDDKFEAQFWILRDSLKITPGELIYARGNINIKENENKSTEEKYANMIAAGTYTKNKIENIIDKKENQNYIRQFLNYAIYLWAPFKFNYSYEPLVLNNFLPPASKGNNINRIITLGILLPFLLIGGSTLIYKKSKFGTLLVSLFIIHTLIHALTWVEWRYLLPILPLVTMVAVYGIIILYNYFSEIKSAEDIIK
jgi:hypothetical protein